MQAMLLNFVRINCAVISFFFWLTYTYAKSVQSNVQSVDRTYDLQLKKKFK